MAMYDLPGCQNDTIGLWYRATHHDCCTETTVPEAQFQRLENPKLAFTTATSKSDCSPQKVVQSDGIMS